MTESTNPTTEKPVVAAIIDTRSGEIIETVTQPKDKTRLYLKVRDELNSEHGRDTFLTLDFSSCQPNTTWVQGKMQNKDPEAFKEATRLSLEYKIWEKKKNITRIEGELAKLEETQNECLALYDDSAQDKREIVSDAFSGQIEETEEELRDQKNVLAKLHNLLKKL
ncbi:hypothetical protein QX249_10145 [Vibrio parahaemolyticus]|uniref:Chromosome partitioning protein ParA n=1 Tax=Vibrio parahaemolyticus TaxID=670 RepID=A0AAW8PYC9_VIBPH|nr:hypothetical protein [Vibrio parahaemolyticus]MDS1821019.1 hypothetical protein [Vibrio parahaemolyticus]